MTDRSGTPQRRRSEEYSGEPDPEAFARGHAQTDTEIHLHPGNFASELRPHMSTTFVQAPPYVPKHKIRVVTAASLFDGHDAAINIPA